MMISFFGSLIIGIIIAFFVAALGVGVLIICYLLYLVLAGIFKIFS